MDVLEILQRMHVEAKAAFRQLEQAGPGDRSSLWAKLKPELVAHEQMEEQYVYDPVVAQAGSRDSQLATFHQKHEQQVKEATHLIEEIGRQDPTSDRFLEKVRTLNQALAQHIEMEESDFWPRIRSDWDSEQLEKAGEQVQNAKKAATAAVR